MSQLIKGDTSTHLQVSIPGATVSPEEQAKREQAALDKIGSVLTPDPSASLTEETTVSTLQKANAELQAQLEALKAKLPVTEEKPPETPQTPASDKPPEKTKVTAETLKPFAEEFTKTGKLSDDSYSKLEDLGLARDIVDGYLSNVAAQSDVLLEQVYKPAGGREGFQKLAQWAKDHLSPEAINEFNTIMATEVDVAKMTATVNKLQLTYDRAMGKDPKAPVHGSGGGFSTGGYETVEEMAAAMRDPRYSGPNRDPAYIREVTRRASLMRT